MEDMVDVNKPDCCALFVDDIMKTLKMNEMKYTAKPDYMKYQKDITKNMRGILIDWVVEVH